MADLDDELLALAGDTSDEEASPPPKPKPQSPSPQPQPPTSSSAKPPSPESSSDMARKGTAKVVQRPRKPKKEDSEEGGLCVFRLAEVSDYS
jgi:RNA polymerase-associated protein RTF1